jgi:hypothetical protein
MATLNQTNDVSTPVLSYQNAVLRWELPDALWGGTYTMRQKGTKYLPIDPEESIPAWTARKERSFLLNAFRRTVNSLTGKVFSKPIILKDDVPDELKAMWEDLDQEGHRGDVLCEDVFRDAMKHGVCHILVDMPRAPQGATLRTEQELNLRPYWIKYNAHQLIGWKAEKVGSKTILTAIRLYEEVTTDDGDYGEVVVKQIREITREEYKVWQLKKKGPRSTAEVWQIVEQGPMTLGYIPLLTFYTRKESFMLGSPPLEDLCWMNVAHWQSSSDQRHILHVARVPLLFGSGMGEGADKVVVGPNRLINAPEGADLKYVEHSGKAIDSGEKDLDRIENEMMLMGFELILPSMRGGGQTATAKSLDYADINSPLQFMAVNFGDVIEQGLKISADWLKLGADAGGSVKVNTEFGITLRDAADVQALIQARLAGEISNETFWAELKRRNILSDDFDASKEQGILEK